jgi:hypothetical protein
MALAPFRRHLEFAAPQAAPRNSCVFFLRHVLLGVAREGDRPALAHHPTVDVLGAEIANRQRAAIPILAALDAADQSVPQLLDQRRRRAGAAIVVAPVFLADLVPFRRVDAEQPNAQLVDDAVSKRQRVFTTAEISRLLDVLPEPVHAIKRAFPNAEIQPIKPPIDWKVGDQLPF